jgi:putative transcriptional regulator
MIAANQTPRAPIDPAHHVGDPELLEYTVGASDDAVSLAVACHLALCRACRAQMRRLDAIGGALLETQAPGELGANALAQTLARLDEPRRPEDAPRAPAPIAPPAGGALAGLDLPAPLRRRVAALPAARWRYVAPGVRGIDLPPLPVRAGGATAQLLCLKPGLGIPRHDHGALEVTLVLTGALLDEEGRLARGDVLFREPGQRHLQRVEAGADCISLVVNAGSFVPLTWTGRLLRLIARP